MPSALFATCVIQNLIAGCMVAANVVISQTEQPSPHFHAGRLALGVLYQMMVIFAVFWPLVPDGRAVPFSKEFAVNLLANALTGYVLVAAGLIVGTLHGIHFHAGWFGAEVAGAYIVGTVLLRSLFPFGGRPNVPVPDRVKTRYSAGAGIYWLGLGLVLLGILELNGVADYVAVGVGVAALLIGLRMGPPSPTTGEN